MVLCLSGSWWGQVWYISSQCIAVSLLPVLEGTRFQFFFSNVLFIYLLGVSILHS